MFAQPEEKNMLSYTKQIVEDHSLMISPKFDRLLLALYGCTDNEGIIDYKYSSGNDIFGRTFHEFKGV
jgi:hypothetical protein